MGKQLVFIDDSGDPGFGKSASSSTMVMAAVAFRSQDEARLAGDAISSFRKNLGWQENAEFKFSKTNKDVVRRLLQKICKYNFSVHAVYIDKSNCGQILQLVDSDKLYNWMIKELLLCIPLDDIYTVLDGRSDKGHRLRVASYIRHEVNAKHYKIKSVKFADSVKDNLVQLADMAAGAINRSVQASKTDSADYIRILKPRITQIKRLEL